MNNKLLIIGLGNPLREDDGLGSAVIALLEKQLPQSLNDSVTLKAQHQTDIIDCEVIKDFSHLIYIDAAGEEYSDGQPVKVEKIAAQYRPPTFTSHLGSIPWLLYIVAEVYGKTPECYLVTVRGSAFNFSSTLTASGQQLISLTVQAVISLAQQFLPTR